VPVYPTINKTSISLPLPTPGSKAIISFTGVDTPAFIIRPLGGTDEVDATIVEYLGALMRGRKE